MLDEGFAESWVNDTHRVLGLKLRPFSLWHRFQLEILDTPILSGKIINPIDLYQACIACRLVYPNPIPGKINWWSLRWCVAGRNHSEECQKFGAYLADFFQPPKFIPPTRKKYHNVDPCHPPPETMQIISSVLSMTGWPEEKVWNMPIGQAYWYAAGHWYQTGQELDFLTPEHLVLQERIAAMKTKQNG